MNKILRYSLIAILAFVCGGAFAEDIIWSEDFSGYAANEVPAGGDYSYVCAGAKTKIMKEKLATGTAPELLVAANGGSFAATIALNGKSGEMILTFKANRDFLKVTADNATVGTVVAAGNDYSYPITVAEGTKNITITISNGDKSKAARLDNIKLYQGVAKEPAGLSWGTASRTVTIGAEDNVFPSLTNANDLAVTYTSSNEKVATIDAEGVISLLKSGTTTITASFAGNDKYEAAAASYTLMVKSNVDISNTPETAYSVAKAKELIEAGEGLDSKVYVSGIVSAVTEISTEYGNANYSISDNGETEGQLAVYRGKGLGGAQIEENGIKVGDKVVVYGKLQDYNGTSQIASGSELYSLNGVTTGVNAITAESAAKDAPLYNLAGQKVSKEYKGVVIQNGKKFVNK